MAYPYAIASDGRTALVDENDYIRQLVEQVLLTSPGERVNRPSFGSGLSQLIFAGQNNELTHATQALIQGSLQQWLGDLIQVQDVTVESHEERLNITVRYVVRRNQQSATIQVSREV